MHSAAATFMSAFISALSSKRKFEIAFEKAKLQNELLRKNST
jgi:hypothetical protein